MVKVLFIIYDLERGGPEMRLLNFARHFSQEISMHICVTSTNVSLLDEFRKCGIPVTIIPIAKPWFEWHKIHCIYKYCRDNAIDVVNVFDIKGLIAAWYIKLIGGKITTVYNHVNSFQMLGETKYKLLKLLLRKCDGFICNSMYSQKQIEDIVPQGFIRVIYNGIETGKFSLDSDMRQRIRHQLGITDDCILLGIVANFRKEKNPDLLIDGFNELSKKNEKLKLLCVGGGALLDHTKKRVTNLGLEEKILFTGYTSDVVDYMQAFDIMVLTSLSEGFPTVILEGMSLGLPVVSSNVGGCAEIIEQNVNGILYESNDLEGFVAAVELLAGNNEIWRQMSNNASVTVRRTFTLEQMISGYTKQYVELCDNKTISSARVK